MLKVFGCAVKHLRRDGRLRLLAPRPAFARRRDPPHPHIVGLAAIGGVKVHHVRRVGIYGHEAQISLASRRRDADLVPDLNTERTSGLGLASGRGRVHEAKMLLKAVAALNQADGRAPTHRRRADRRRGLGNGDAKRRLLGIAHDGGRLQAEAHSKLRRPDRGDLRGAILILSLLAGPSYLLCWLGGVDGGLSRLARASSQHNLHVMRGPLNNLAQPFQ